MSDESLALLRHAQALAVTQALDAVEQDKAAQVAVEASPEGVEASISATVRSTPAALSWLKGGRVTGYLHQRWTGAKSWGARFTKPL